MASQKVRNLNLKEKYEAVLMSERERKSVKEISVFFQCGTSQIYNILKKKEEIKDRFLSSAENEKNVKKNRINSNENLNEAVFEWFRMARSKCFPISGPILQEQALKIAKNFKLDGFAASNGWLRCFRQRYNISFKTTCGESKSVDENSVALWKTKLRDLCDGYEASNIANCDETALFYKVLPNKTLHLKNERCSGGKLSKDRLTVMLTVFANGSKLDKPIIIGKSLNPRCFKGLYKKKLRCDYYANNKAWMTSKIFKEYLTKMNLEMVSQGRHILLFLDNASSHLPLELSNIKLVFIPPNTTSLLQPLDAGIIQAFKLNYRKLVLENLLVNMESCKNSNELVKSINVLDAINYSFQANKSIASSCIQNCFKNCGFEIGDIFEEFEPRNQKISLQNIIKIIYEDNIFSANDYLTVDQNCYTECNEIELESIVGLVQSANNDTDPVQTISDEEDEDQQKGEEKVVSMSEAFNYLNGLEKFFKQNGKTEHFNALVDIKFQMTKDCCNKKMVQSTLDSFMYRLDE